MNQPMSPVTFHGDTIFCVTHENQPYTPAKPIVENLGLGWPSQSQKLNANKDRWGVTIIVIPTESGDQQTLCIPVRKLPAFLASINPNKVSPTLRPKIELYQNECDDALWNYWTKGQATRQPAAQPALPDTSPLTQSSRAELKAIVDAKLSTYPSDIQGKARSEIWTRFNRHFKIAEYAQLPMCQMPDARDYLVEMKPKALATIEAKAEPAALPPSSVPATRGRDRAQSQTELRLMDMMNEVNSLDSMNYKLEDFFSRLSAISGPLNLLAIDAMRRTNDRVPTDSLIQTLHYHRWDAKEHVRDAANAAREACRSAIVVARLLGV